MKNVMLFNDEDIKDMSDQVESENAKGDGEAEEEY
jgi:hypothetical protein